MERPHPLQAPDLDEAERDHEDRAEARQASRNRWAILSDRARYEHQHGTMDGPPETHRWDADPF